MVFKLAQGTGKGWLRHSAFLGGVTKMLLTGKHHKHFEFVDHGVSGAFRSYPHMVAHFM